MSDSSSIEWTDSTWNIVTGCTRVSPGCAHCYIERTPPFRMVKRRFARVGTVETTGVTLHVDRLTKPPRGPKVFTPSLGDLFHEAVPAWFVRDAFDAMRLFSDRTFQVLTKRPERARELFLDGHFMLPANVWLGVSIENARYTWRADVLREIPAAVRFISAEPLLGSLYPEPSDTDFTIEHGRKSCGWCGAVMETSQFQCASAFCEGRLGRKLLDLTGIDWVIVGGESGPGARTFYLEHAREIIRACQRECDDCWEDGLIYDAPPGASPCAHRPAIFVKQLGARPLDSTPDLSVGRVLKLRDRKGGDPDEWPADLRIREFPAQAVRV